MLFAGVFDGHGGDKISQYASTRLPLLVEYILNREISKYSDVETAITVSLKKSFLQLQSECFSGYYMLDNPVYEREEVFHKDSVGSGGSTAVVAVIHGLFLSHFVGLLFERK